MKTMKVLVPLFLSLLGCNEQGTSSVATVKGTPVKVVPFGEQTQNASLEYSGTLQENRVTPISFAVPGRVIELFVNDGDTVQQGQLLAVLDSTSLHETYLANVAKQAQAQDAYKRLKPMYDNGSVTAVKFVEVETGLAQANSLVQISQKNLQEARLIAPVKGIVVKKNLEVGQNVSPNLAVFSLLDPQYLDAVFAVPETEILNIHNGSSILITLPGNSSQSFAAKVTEIAIQANEFSRSYPVRVRIDNRKGMLRMGMACHGQIELPTSSSVYTLPLQAVLEKGDGTRYVYIVKNGQSLERKVQVDGFLGSELRIQSGVSIGDLIVVEGMHGITHGSKVTY